MAAGMDSPDDVDVQPPVSPLVERLLSDLAEVVEALGRLDRDFIALARAEGTSWKTIGDAFGISRQAAASYYSAEPTDPPTRPRRPRRQKRAAEPD
jgi:hypothetical protein